MLPAWCARRRGMTPLMYVISTKSTPTQMWAHLSQAVIANFEPYSVDC